MLRVLLFVAVVMLTIYCIVELAQTKGARVRAMPRWLWLFVVICVPVIGPFAWLSAGRPSSRALSPPTTTRTSCAACAEIHFDCFCGEIAPKRKGRQCLTALMP